MLLRGGETPAVWTNTRGLVMAVAYDRQQSTKVRIRVFDPSAAQDASTARRHVHFTSFALTFNEYTSSLTHGKFVLAQLVPVPAERERCCCTFLINEYRLF